MFVIQITFKDRAALAANRDAHFGWLREGSEAGVILAAGTVVPPETSGAPDAGMILAAGADKAALVTLLEHAPLITSGAATAEIVELRLSFTDPRLAFLQPSKA